MVVVTVYGGVYERTVWVVCAEVTVCVSAVCLKVTLRIKQIGVTRAGAQAVHTTNSHGYSVDAVHTIRLQHLWIPCTQ